MAAENSAPHILWEEKISIEPDLGDPRQSTYKALPSPPKTPKRVISKYRFSGVVPLVLSLAAFVLALVVVLAGQRDGMFEGQYLVALNTSRVGQDVVRFEKASSSSAAAPATSSTASPLSPAKPDDPLSELDSILGSLSSNLTDAVNTGLEDVINDAVEGVVKQMGVRDYYYVYLQRICSGSFSSKNGSNADGVAVTDCVSWDDAGNSIAALSSNIRSSVVIGQTQVSIPLLAKLTSSLDSILHSLGALRRAMLAFLIINLTGSILSVVLTLPAMYFPQSRLLIYCNMFWPALATVFAFIAAILLSGVTVLVGIMNGFGETVGVQIRQGGTALLLVWLSFVFVGLAAFYWACVWFVETRQSSFVKRRREEDEVGQWRGIFREVWRDVNGRRRKPRVREGI